MARYGTGVASLALIPPSGRSRAPSRAIRSRSASRRFVAGYRSSPRSRLGASAANRLPAAALRSVFGLAFRPRPEKRWRLPVRRLCALPPPAEPLVTLPAHRCDFVCLVYFVVQKTTRAIVSMPPLLRCIA